RDSSRGETSPRDDISALPPCGRGQQGSIENNGWKLIDRNGADLNRTPPRRSRHGSLPPEGGGRLSVWGPSRPHHHPLRAYADFLLFLSSSTSVNSASTTSSLAASLAASASACCLYMASPSFIEVWASVLVLALIASASSPFSASFRSLTASSMARRSLSATLEPCSDSADRKSTRLNSSHT